ncbi:11265_t:CDS:2, partial [Gigaspora rosea]
TRIITKTGAYRFHDPLSTVSPKLAPTEPRKNERQPKPTKSYVEQGPIPMEINRAEVSCNNGATRKNNGKKLTPELKESYKRKELCFKCERKGHMAHDCRSKCNEHGNEANIASASHEINENKIVTDTIINREALLKVDGQ